jgi:hypothetical protein
MHAEEQKKPKPAKKRKEAVVVKSSEGTCSEGTCGTCAHTNTEAHACTQKSRKAENRRNPSQQRKGR